MLISLLQSIPSATVISSIDDYPDKGWVMLDANRISHIQFRLQVSGLDFVKILDDPLKTEKCPNPIATILKFREKDGVLHRRQEYYIRDNWEKGNSCGNTPFPEEEDLSRKKTTSKVTRGESVLDESENTSTDEELSKKKFVIKKRRSARPKKNPRHSNQEQYIVVPLSVQNVTPHAEGERHKKTTPTGVLRKLNSNKERELGNPPIRIKGQIQVHSKRKEKKVGTSAPMPKDDDLLITALGKRKQKQPVKKLSNKKRNIDPKTPSSKGKEQTICQPSSINDETTSQPSIAKVSEIIEKKSSIPTAVEDISSQLELDKEKPVEDITDLTQEKTLDAIANVASEMIQKEQPIAGIKPEDLIAQPLNVVPILVAPPLDM